MEGARAHGRAFLLFGLASWADAVVQSQDEQARAPVRRGAAGRAGFGARRACGSR